MLWFSQLLLSWDILHGQMGKSEDLTCPLQLEEAYPVNEYESSFKHTSQGSPFLEMTTSDH